MSIFKEFNNSTFRIQYHHILTLPISHTFAQIPSFVQTQVFWEVMLCCCVSSVSCVMCRGITQPYCAVVWAVCHVSCVEGSHSLTVLLCEQCVMCRGITQPCCAVVWAVCHVSCVKGSHSLTVLLCEQCVMCRGITQPSCWERLTPKRKTLRSFEMSQNARMTTQQHITKT